MLQINTGRRTCIAIVISQMMTPAQLNAADFIVGNSSELVTAIVTANSNSEADVIDLLGNDIVLTSIDNLPANGLPIIGSDTGNPLTIKNGTIRRAPASASEFRIIDVAENAQLTIDEVTISGGQISSDSNLFGGAIQNRGMVTLSKSTVSENFAYGAAGIMNVTITSTLHLNNTTISSNSAVAAGGGIYNNYGVLTLVNSTVAGNSASRGGGLRSRTKSGSGEVSLVNSLFTSNQSIQGTNDLSIALSATQLPISNAISNLIEISYGAEGVVNGVDGNIVGQGPAQASSLAPNGGPTNTHALLGGSPAIDAGDNASCLKLDQRGRDRSDGNCDIGSYEFEVGIEAKDSCFVTKSSNGNVVVFCL